MIRKGFPWVKTSKYIRLLEDLPIKSAPVLEIHGALANSKLGQDVFARIPYESCFANFPGVKHVALLTDRSVIDVVLDFLKKHTK